MANLSDVLASGLIKKVIRGEILLGSGAATANATIAAVDMANCVIRLEGCRPGWPPDDAQNHLAYIDLPNATTVRATRAATSSSVYVAFTVTEYFRVKRISHGEITMTSSATGSATIAALDLSRSIIVTRGMRGITSIGGETSARHSATLGLSSSTTATAARASGTGTAIATFSIVEFEP